MSAPSTTAQCTTAQLRLTIIDLLVVCPAVSSSFSEILIGSESSKVLSLPGAKVPGNESSRERKFHLWNFRSRERKYAGTKPSQILCRRPARIKLFKETATKKLKDELPLWFPVTNFVLQLTSATVNKCHPPNRQSLLNISYSHKPACALKINGWGTIRASSL